MFGCSPSSLSPDARLADTVPNDAAAQVCAVDASAEAPASSCWAVGRMITRTGCSDTHCEWDGGVLVRNADYASCGIAAPDPSSDAQPSGGLAQMAGSLSLDDDLCEFHAVVAPECVAGPTALFFDAELSSAMGGAVPAGAKPYIEAFSSPTHLAPSVGDSTEMGTGLYRIGPVTFDVSGQWTVTIHFFSTCRDSLANSPHAHVTFTLLVP